MGGMIKVKGGKIRSFQVMFLDLQDLNSLVPRDFIAQRSVTVK